LLARTAAEGILEETSRLGTASEAGALAEGFGYVVAAGAERHAGVHPASSPLLAMLAAPARHGRADHVSSMRRDPSGRLDAAALVGHVFYLTVAGGTHDVSKLTLRGVGMDEMPAIERVFYRAFAYFLGPEATLAQARRATLNAAAELAGTASPAWQQLRLAWSAVGVPEEGQ
jgi:Zn-dependent metalloprotease